MAKRSLEITLLGYGFLLVFGFILLCTLTLSFASFYAPDWLQQIPEYADVDIKMIQAASVLSSLFCMLISLGFIGVLSLKEWGRKLVILMSIVMCVFSLLNVFLVRGGLETQGLVTTAIFLTLIIILSRKNVRMQFKSFDTSKYDRKAILVVDDDEIFLKTVKKILLSEGFSVLTAQTGEKGLQIAKMQKPDLIILDVILPGVKGREVCAKLKEDEETKDIPVMFVTAKDSHDDREAEKAVGAIAHLTKPVNPRELLPEIHKVFD